MKIAVLGGGSWGSAIYKLLTMAGHNVKIWARNEAVVENLKKGENPYYLPGISLPKAYASINLREILNGVDIIVYAIPAQHMREVLEKVVECCYVKKLVHVNLSKGIEMRTGLRMEEVFKEILGDGIHYCTLSGPSHAEEVARDVPTSVVVASRDEDTAKEVQKAFNTVTFRVYRSVDVLGVEIAGALKNVIAIAAGVVDGIGGWDNSKAALITRGLAEMARYGEYFGAMKETFMGLAGMGDLIVTCTSRHSRNRYVGEMIGRGKKLKEILAEMRMVAEGVYTTKIVYKISRKKGIYMPITEIVYKVLYEGMEVKEGMHYLLTRPLKAEM